MERIDRTKLGIAAMWRNPSVRRLAWTMITLLFVMCLLLALYNHYATERLKRQWLDQEYAIAGALSERNPELAEQWLKLLAEPPSSEAVEAGHRWMAEYGMTEKLDARWLPVLGSFQAWSLGLLLSGGLLLIALLAFWLLLESRSQLRMLRSLAVSLDDTVKHNLPMAKRIYGEGEIGMLANGVQELSLRLRETINQLNRDKTYLKDTVADISHQLKTPLASLIIYIDLLADRKTDPATAAEFLKTCRQELERIEWLILTLLKLARIEADALELNIEPAPFSSTVRASLASVARIADAKQISLRMTEHDEPLVIAHDPHWLAEAISNVLKNAVEIIPAGGEITVTLEQTPILIRLTIMDNGPGIAEEHLPHIFKKFYRTSSGGSGVGLGLPLAKSIVEKHGGVLSAANNPEGGAVFTFALPLQPLPADDISSLTKL